MHCLNCEHKLGPLIVIEYAVWIFYSGKSSVTNTVVKPNNYSKLDQSNASQSIKFMVVMEHLVLYKNNSKD